MLTVFYNTLMTLSIRLAEIGFRLVDVDLNKDILYVVADRRGRTDEEIETLVREIKVLIYATYLFRLNIVACPKLKYKILEHEEYIKLSN